MIYAKLWLAFYQVCQGVIMTYQQKFSQLYRIYLEDTDAGGIVYHANYLKFFERCRRDWLRQLGMTSYFYAQVSHDGKDNIQNFTQFVVSDIHIRYHLPILLDMQIMVSVEVEKIKSASLQLKQCIYDENQQLLSQATVMLTCVRNQLDNQSKLQIRPTRLPADFLALIHNE